MKTLRELRIELKSTYDPKADTCLSSARFRACRGALEIALTTFKEFRSGASRTEHGSFLIESVEDAEKLAELCNLYIKENKNKNFDKYQDPNAVITHTHYPEQEKREDNDHSKLHLPVSQR